MMADAGQFLSSLLNFDKESLTEETIMKLEKYVNDPNFQPAKIIKVKISGSRKGADPGRM